MSPRALLRAARDEAAKLARLTREDAEQLAAVFWQVASRQARDARDELRRSLAARAGRPR
jgi:vacuolar-type H+-ATPase subunit H